MAEFCVVSRGTQAAKAKEGTVDAEAEAEPEPEPEPEAQAEAGDPSSSGTRTQPSLGAGGLGGGWLWGGWLIGCGGWQNNLLCPSASSLARSGQGAAHTAPTARLHV